jgi:hypothetical protein
MGDKVIKNAIVSGGVTRGSGIFGSQLRWQRPVIAQAEQPDPLALIIAVDRGILPGESHQDGHRRHDERNSIQAHAAQSYADLHICRSFIFRDFLKRQAAR